MQGDCGIADFLIEGSSDQTQEQTAQHRNGNRKDKGNQAEQYTQIGNHAQKTQHQKRTEAHQDEQNLGTPHFQLVAIGAFCGNLHGLGQGNIRLRNQNVGGKTVFVRTDNGKNGTGKGNQRPQENPKICPGKTQNHALDGVPVLEAVKQLHGFYFFATVTMEVDH